MPYENARAGARFPPLPARPPGAGICLADGRPAPAPSRSTPRSARSSSTRCARPPSPRRACASATTAGRRASGSTASRTPTGSRHFARFEPLPGSFPEPLALRYHGHQFRVYNPDLGDGRGFLFAQLARPRRRPPARPRHQGLRPDPLVARRRRPADAEGRRARDPRHRDARGARRLHLEDLLADRDRRGADPRRRALADPLLGARPPLAQPHPHRQLPAPRRPRRDRRAPPPRRPFDRPLLARRRRRRRPGRRPLRRASSAPWRRSAPSGSPPASSTACSTPTTSTITGESFDYGPWRFLDRFDPASPPPTSTRPASTAFARQPEALNWNLARLGECLMPLSAREAIEPSFESFPERFQTALARQTFARLGLLPGDDPAAARALMHRFWGAMQETAPPFQQVFHDLLGGGLPDRLRASPLRPLFETAAWAEVIEDLRALAPAPGLAAAPPTPPPTTRPKPWSSPRSRRSGPRSTATTTGAPLAAKIARDPRRRRPQRRARPAVGDRTPAPGTSRSPDDQAGRLAHAVVIRSAGIRSAIALFSACLGGVFPDERPACAERRGLERGLRRRAGSSCRTAEHHTRCQTNGVENPAYLTGICLSGGGIRSATVSLGIMQTLAGAGLVRHLDYMSSVSGGGYAAQRRRLPLRPRRRRRRPRRHLPVRRRRPRARGPAPRGTEAALPAQPRRLSGAERPARPRHRRRRGGALAAAQHLHLGDDHRGRARPPDERLPGADASGGSAAPTSPAACSTPSAPATPSSTPCSSPPRGSHWRSPR